MCSRGVVPPTSPPPPPTHTGVSGGSLKGILAGVTASDFTFNKVSELHAHGAVVSAVCSRAGFPEPDHHFSLRVLFTGGRDRDRHSAVGAASFTRVENELAAYGKLPQSTGNVLRCWGRFFDEVPKSLVDLLEAKDHAVVEKLEYQQQQRYCSA